MRLVRDLDEGLSYYNSYERLLIWYMSCEKMSLKGTLFLYDVLFI